MRKIALCLCLFLMISIVAAGCGSKPAEPGSTPGTSSPAAQSTAPAESSQKDPVNLKFVIWGSAAHVEMYNSLLTNFSGSNPKTTVEIITAPFAEITEKLTSMIASGSPPDVAWWSEFTMMYFADEGYFLSLDDAIKEWGTDWDKDDFYPWTLDTGKWKGNQYLLPFSVGGNVIAYNKTMFDAAEVAYPDENWTWDDYGNALSKLTKGEGKDKVYGGSNTFLENPALLGYITKAHGADLFNADYTKSSFYSKENIEVIKKLYSWYEKGYVPPIGTKANFAQGQGAMTLLTNSGVAAIEKAGIDYDVAPVPTGPAGRYTASGYAGMVVMKTSQHQEEALNFMKFLTGKESMKAHAAFFGSPRKSVVTSADYLKGDQWPEHKEYLQQAQEYVVDYPHFPKYSEFEILAKEQASLLLAKKQSVEDTLKNIDDKTNELLGVK